MKQDLGGAKQGNSFLWSCRHLLFQEGPGRAASTSPLPALPNSQGTLRAAGAILAHWGTSLVLPRPQSYLLSPPEQWRREGGWACQGMACQSQRPGVSSPSSLPTRCCSRRREEVQTSAALCPGNIL